MRGQYLERREILTNNSVTLHTPPGNPDEYRELETDLADCTTTTTGQTLNHCLEDLAGRMKASMDRQDLL